MAEIDAPGLTDRMFTAAKGLLGDIRPESLQFVESRLAKMAEAITNIADRGNNGEIVIGDASLYMNLQKNVARCSLYGLKDVGVLAVDAAIDAALQSVKEEVNERLGFKLL